MKRLESKPSQARERRGCLAERRGAVAVEFAFMAPILLAIMMGMIGLTRVFEAQNLLEVAAREGARFAAMDREGMLQEGQTTNEKIETDLKNFLATNGIDRDDVTVEIKDAEDPTEDFDLDDPDNNLKLFEVHVSVDYSSVSFTPVSTESDYTLSASITFRNGNATISQ